MITRRVELLIQTPEAGEPASITIEVTGELVPLVDEIAAQIHGLRNHLTALNVLHARLIHLDDNPQSTTNNPPPSTIDAGSKSTAVRK